MKKIFFLIFSISLFFSACKTTQLSSVDDDIYADPIEEKRIALAKAEALKKKQAEENAAALAAQQAQKEKDAANPYYKDPEYNADDYYDYAYASRMRRFQNPVMGTGYYDNYYTNSYWYNQNPNCYGTSIYTSYNYWGQSPQIGIYGGNSWGNPYYCNNGYNNYGGYSSWNNPYYSNYGYGYQPWGYNNYYNNPWNNPYVYGNNNNQNWGYYNSYDVNSNYTYAPRQGNSGSNSVRGSYAGMPVPKEFNSEREKLVNAVIEQQESTPRFQNSERKVRNTSAANENGNTGFSSEKVKSYNSTIENSNSPSSGNNSTRGNNWSSSTNSNSSGNNSAGTKSTPSRANSSGTKISESENSNFNNNSQNRSSGGSSSGSGGTISAPRNTGGGTSKPR